jgi:superfamily II RNA helicase
VLEHGDVFAESDVVVMTTEILRNIMYRSQAEQADTTEDRLADVGLVVLDEVRPLTLTPPPT